MRNEFAGSKRGISGASPLPRARDNSDEALIGKIASGNRLAMQVLFARHHARVYRFVLRLVGNHALAEDLTSEVFLSVWRQAHRFEARSAATTWLLAIARYKALGELRRRSEASSEEANVDAIDPAADPEAAFQIKHRGEILRRCLTRLSREHSISSTITKNPCRRSLRSSVFPAIPSRPECSTHGGNCRSCSKPKVSWERGRSAPTADSKSEPCVR
jgi:RNA polymerase sigma factor (sigma-70 family)